MKTKFFSDLICLILSAALLLTGIFGLFGSLSREGALYSAAKNTLAAKQKTDTIPAFFFSALQNGQIDLNWENSTANSGGSAKLLSNLDKNAASLSLSAKRGEASLTADAALDENTLSLNIKDSRFFIARKSCAQDFRDSALSALLTLLSPKAHQTGEDIFAALDTSSDGKKSVLKKEAAKFYAKLSPKVKKSTEEVPADTPFEAKCTTLSFDGENLSRALSYFSNKQRKKEALVEALCLLSARAASARGLDPATEEAKTRAYLSKDNTALSDFAASLSATDADFQAKFFTKGSYLVAVKLDFTLAKPQKQTLSAFLFFGENPKKDSLIQVDFSLTKAVSEEESEAAQLHFRNEITEDSKSAFVQETSFSLSDPASILLAKEDETGEKNFSARIVWGKAKGDLAVRWTLDGTETSLRGEVGEWKKGKLLSFSLSSAEKNKTPLFGGAAFQFEVKKKAEKTAKPSTEGSELLKADGASLTEALLKLAGVIPDLTLPENSEGEVLS